MQLAGVFKLAFGEFIGRGHSIVEQSRGVDARELLLLTRQGVVELPRLEATLEAAGPQVVREVEQGLVGARRLRVLRLRRAISCLRSLFQLGFSRETWRLNQLPSEALGLRCRLEGVELLHGAGLVGGPLHRTQTGGSCLELVRTSREPLHRVQGRLKGGRWTSAPAPSRRGRGSRHGLNGLEDEGVGSSLIGADVLSVQLTAQSHVIYRPALFSQGVELSTSHSLGGLPTELSRLSRQVGVSQDLSVGGHGDHRKVGEGFDRNPE